ncbi:MAG: hypothetical protein GY868_21115, partial [Deltaproteobacteria bacterium]|nr:hypothetical protein [Deltaproteobacteria bacterium]
VIGVVSVTEKVGSDFFAQDEREMLLLVVGQVISALENNRLAEALNQKQKTLKKKNAELKKLEKLRTDLFNMLIHDLKGPISEIVANLDILSYTLEDENAQFVEIAQQGCNTLYNMVTNLLDISRLEEGQMPFVYEDICPRELIKEAVARLLVSGKSKALTIEEQFPEENSVRLHGDRATLVRVLQNFITNAIQYSPQGGAVTVGYQRSALKRVELFVKDSGPGVKPEFQEVIFDKYKQVDKQADGRLYTTGLGLAFCKLAVEAHHGSVGVESTPGAGSKFYFVVAVE